MPLKKAPSNRKVSANDKFNLFTSDILDPLKTPGILLPDYTAQPLVRSVSFLGSTSHRSSLIVPTNGDGSRHSNLILSRDWTPVPVFPRGS